MVAHERLVELRAGEPTARLLDAERRVARDYGYQSWRALKSYVSSLGPTGRPSQRPSHLPELDAIDAWPAFTPERPLKVLVSACLAGLRVGVDGSSNGTYPNIRHLVALPNVEAVLFCPEDFSFGTPRATPDIHGGTGAEVLDGKARVIASSGEDWTDGMIRAAQEMLGRAQAHRVRLAVLMDISAACGSQVIYRGARTNAPHQIGQGVCAALLARNGIPVVSQRDYRTLDRIMRRLDPAHEARDDLKDHHEIDWYRGYFGPPVEP
jgi:uncharacterized protein YbbK (DUF523 family)